MSWFSSLVSVRDFRTESVSPSSSPSPERKSAEWVSPTSTHRVEIVDFDTAREEANNNFYDNVRKVEEEIRKSR